MRIETILKELLEVHAGDADLLALQLRVSPASVQRWLNGVVKPRAEYEAKLRRIHSDLAISGVRVNERAATYRVAPHHPMITEAVDATLKSIREILHKRGHLSSRSQALDELSKLLFGHISQLRSGRKGISRQTLGADDAHLALSLKQFVDKAVQQNLPDSLVHAVDVQDFQLRLKSHENELAAEVIDCFERLQRQTSSFSFRGFDILNEVFGKFLADSFVDEKELGQYLTPREVITFMCGLALDGLSDSEVAIFSSPKTCAEFGLILDPSCGVGSFLAEIISQLSERLTVDEASHPSWLESMLNHVLVGIDKSERMVRLALTNLAMFGFPIAKLYLANALSRNGADGRLTESFVGKAKIILTNPPFGACFQGNDLIKYKIATRWSRRLPARLDSEVLFIERYLDWLAPGGQLLAIVPDSILTNKGVFEDLRRGIVKEIELCSVVSLPTVTFGIAGTNTKTSVLHLRKAKKNGTRPRNSTAFAICNDIGFTVATKSNHRVKIIQGQGDLPKILDVLTTGTLTAPNVRVVENATSYERWDAQHHASLTAEIEQRLNGSGDDDVCVRAVAELVDERVDPRRWGAKNFNYIEISDIDTQTGVIYSNAVDVSATPSRARKLVKAGDVLVSTVRPERGVVGVVGDHQDNAICTTGLAVLRPKAIHPVALAYLLKTKFAVAQLTRNNVGIAYPAIEESCLLGVLLPVRRRDLRDLEKRAVEIIDAERRVHSTRLAFLTTIEQLGDRWRQMSFKEDPKPHRVNQTTSRRQSRKSGFDSHDPGTFRLEAGHTA